jgi:hypothetical protein
MPIKQDDVFQQNTINYTPTTNSFANIEQMMSKNHQFLYNLEPSINIYISLRFCISNGHKILQFRKIGLERY